MTAPLTPADCDLQDFPFMPLHVARLRDSDLAGEESPEACWYAVMLWAASWHQLPAASLPDNEAVLARLCGLGRDLRTFKKHRAGAMRGFILCDDGRYYHPVVAEQARDAWESKLQQRWRTECARIKKANQRNGTDDPLPAFADWQSLHYPKPVPRDKTGTRTLSPSGNGLQETETGTGIYIPLSSDNGAAPEKIDEDAQFWANSKAYLARRGQKNPGGLIGMWVKQHGKAETASALTQAQLERPPEVIAFIQGCFRKQVREAADGPLC